MRLGFICIPREEDFRFAAEHGFPVVEWNVNGPAEKLLRLEADLAGWIRRYGVRFSAIGQFDRDRMSEDPAIRHAEWEHDRAIIDFCALYEVPTFLCAPGRAQPGLSFEANCQRAIETLGERVAYAAKQGVRVALYNCRLSNCTYGPAAWQIVLPALPELGIKFDPSHPFYDGKDYLAEARDWGDRFIHFHAKDVLTVGGKRLEDPPAGMGQIAWGPLLHILHRHNYPGDIILEPHSGTWSGDRYFRGILIGRRMLEPFVF
jgi:sugar phosphate isomerase/epimerase